MYIPWPPEYAAFWYGGVEETTPIVKSTVKRIRCSGCGKFMKLDDTYLIIENTYLKSHMKEDCLTKVYAKAREHRGGFEFASMGAKDYGKV